MATKKRPKKKAPPPIIVADEGELAKALEELGVDLYSSNDTRNSPAPEVDVKIQGRGRQPLTDAVIRKHEIPDRIADQMIQQSFESAQEQWWDAQREDDEIRHIFGKTVPIVAAGRSGGHLVADVSIYDFADETEDGYGFVVNRGKVDAWTDYAQDVKDSISPAAVDAALSEQLKIDLEHGQFNGEALDWWEQNLQPDL